MRLQQNVFGCAIFWYPREDMPKPIESFSFTSAPTMIRALTLLGCGLPIDYHWKFATGAASASPTNVCASSRIRRR